MSDVIEFVRVNKAWRELGCSPASGWRYVNRGLLPKTVKIGPNSTAFVRAEFERAKAALIEGRIPQPTDGRPITTHDIASATTAVKAPKSVNANTKAAWRVKKTAPLPIGNGVSDVRR